MLSGTTPLLYVLAQALVELIPVSALPMPSFDSEFPLAFLDGYTRAFLLCTLIPPVVAASPFPELSDSPWTLLFCSFVSPYEPPPAEHCYLISCLPALLPCSRRA